MNFLFKSVAILSVLASTVGLAFAQAQPPTVPEPGALALVAVGGLALWASKKRREK